MTKKELIEQVRMNSEWAEVVVESVLNKALAIITDELKHGGSVNIADFGKFEVTSRKAHEGRDPRTGEKILIHARKTVTFKPFKQLKEVVNR